MRSGTRCAQPVQVAQKWWNAVVAGTQCEMRSLQVVMLQVFRVMLRVFLVKLDVFLLMLDVFRLMLHVFRVMLQETRATLHASAVRVCRIHKVHWKLAILQETWTNVQLHSFNKFRTSCDFPANSANVSETVTSVGWRGGCVGSVSARSLQTEPTARLWVRVRSTDVYRVISLGKIFTTTRLG